MLPALLFHKCHVFLHCAVTATCRSKLNMLNFSAKTSASQATHTYCKGLTNTDYWIQILSFIRDMHLPVRTRLCRCNRCRVQHREKKSFRSVSAFLTAHTADQLHMKTQVKVKLDPVHPWTAALKLCLALCSTLIHMLVCTLSRAALLRLPSVHTVSS